MTKLTTVILLICISVITLSGFKSDPPVNSTSKVEVIINAKKRLSGKISIALCNDEKTFMSLSFKDATIDMPIDGPISYTFENVPVGVYSIRIFQDEDGDGKLSALNNGLPKEPFGFSKNPSMRYGPPTWQNTSFELKENTSLSIDLVKFEF